MAAAFAAEAMWTVSADGTVIRRMRDDKMTPLTRYPKAAPNSAGLAFDGLYLWTLDARAKVLRKHLVDRELSVISTYKWRGVKPAGLVFDGKTLWTLDAADRRLQRHGLERPEEIIGAFPLPEYAEGAYLPTGVSWDGARFWTVGEAKDGKGPARLRERRLRSLGKSGKWRSGVQLWWRRWGARLGRKFGAWRLVFSHLRTIGWKWGAVCSGTHRFFRSTSSGQTEADVGERRPSDGVSRRQFFRAGRS